MRLDCKLYAHVLLLLHAWYVSRRRGLSSRMTCTLRLLREGDVNSGRGEGALSSSDAQQGDWRCVVLGSVFTPWQRPCSRTLVDSDSQALLPRKHYCP